MSQDLLCSVTQYAMKNDLVSQDIWNLILLKLDVIDIWKRFVFVSKKCNLIVKNFISNETIFNVFLSHYQSAWCKSFDYLKMQYKPKEKKLDPVHEYLGEKLSCKYIPIENDVFYTQRNNILIIHDPATLHFYELTLGKDPLSFISFFRDVKEFTIIRNAIFWVEGKDIVIMFQKDNFGSLYILKFEISTRENGRFKVLGYRSPITEKEIVKFNSDVGQFYILKKNDFKAFDLDWKNLNLIYNGTKYGNELVFNIKGSNINFVLWNIYFENSISDARESEMKIHKFKFESGICKFEIINSIDGKQIIDIFQNCEPSMYLRFDVTPYNSKGNILIFITYIIADRSGFQFKHSFITLDPNFHYSMKNYQITRLSDTDSVFPPDVYYTQTTTSTQFYDYISKRNIYICYPQV